MNDETHVSRRKFMAGTVAAAGSMLLGSAAHAQPSKTNAMDIDTFKKTVKGTVAVAGDTNFAEMLHGNLWNQFIPDRAPQVIVRIQDEDDIIAAIHFARENSLKVTVRGGGHNWCQPTLRNGGLLIDISELNQVVSIDVENRKAILQPIISNRDVQKLLNPKGLSYPTGHCPQVKLSGYLLGGGMAWNPTVWGSGLDGVEAIELVTAEGKLITASKDENPDYFWAARGAGSGFFGVVTRYHLKLVALPKAIHGSTYYYSMEDAVEVGRWLGDLASSLSPALELSLFLIEAPAELKDQAAKHGNKVAMVTGGAFADTPEEAKAILQPLESGPVKPLSSAFATPLVFEELFDASGALWPEGVRARVETTFSNTNPGDLVKLIQSQIENTPSPTTVFLYTIFCGPNVPAKHTDTALSMSGKVYGGPWTMWWDAKDDQVNSEWHQKIIETLRPFNVGYYIGESDTVTRPATAVQAYAPENWQKLADLREKYDPDGLFFGYFDGFSGVRSA